jgi:hypothetical protein
MRRAPLAFTFLLGLASGLAPAGEEPPVRATVRLWLDTEHPLPALAAASAALAHEPRSAAAWAALAGALFRNADFDAAEAAARRALALDPDDPDALVALARCLETLAQHAGAREQLEKAVRIEPRHAAALRLLAGKLDLNADRARALELTRRFLEARPPGQELFLEHAALILKILAALGDTPLAQRPPHAERPERIALPLRVTEQGLAVELEIGGLKRLCGLDTGEESLTVTAETAKALGLKALAALPAVTATGIERMQIVLVPKIEAGGFRVSNVLSAVGVRDLVGPGFFDGCRVKLDFFARQLVLTRQEPDAAPDPKDLLGAPEGAERCRFRALGKLIWAPVSCPDAPAPLRARLAWGVLDSGCEYPAGVTPRYLEALRCVKGRGPIALPFRAELGGAAKEEGATEVLWALPDFALGFLGAEVKADGAVAAGPFAAVAKSCEAEPDVLIGWPAMRQALKSLEVDFQRGVLTYELRQGRARR